VPVAELLTPSAGLRATVARGATAYEIRAAMHADGALTMRDRALALVASGRTSIEEVDRVLADEASATRRSGACAATSHSRSCRFSC
jgi:type II secretory ATPase GspE/PulE/Tfp pilus assembly ATPase PilB-like protein